MSKADNVGATDLARAQREAAEAKIEAILAREGPLSAIQLVGLTHMSRATIERHITRMRRIGVVKKLDEPYIDERTKRASTIFALGTENDVEFKREPVVVTIHRHPQDVALFGEYRAERRAA